MPEKVVKMRSTEELRAVTVCVVLRKFRLGEKFNGSVSQNTRGTFKSHLLFDSSYFQTFLSLFLFLVSVCSVAVRKSQQVRSCPGSVGCSSGSSCCPFPLLRHLQEGLSCSKMWLEEGRGMEKCFGRMSKTLETLINSHFSLFAAFLLERQKEGRECDSWQMGCEDLNGKMGTVRSKLFPSFSIMPFWMETSAAWSNLGVS